MALEQAQAAYEFDHEENTVFSKLADGMIFVAVAKFVIGALIALGVFALKSSIIGVVTSGVIAIGFMALGLLQYTAARHFRLIVTTQGHDRDNLMAAVNDLAETYQLQRWMWILLAAIVLVGLAATTAGWS